MLGSQRNAKSPTLPVTIGQALRNSLANWQAAIVRGRLQLEVSADDWLLNDACPRELSNWFDSALATAVDRSPVGGEVSISMCHTLRGLEIEIADQGELPAGQTSHAFAPCRSESQPLGRSNRKAALHSNRGSADYRLFIARCPQGGVASTFVYTDAQTQIARRVA